MTMTEFEIRRIERINESINDLTKAMLQLAGVVSNANDAIRQFGTVYEQAIEAAKKPRQKRSSAAREYDPNFIDAWVAYPKRNGSNPKAAAFKAWHARVKQSNDHIAEIHLMFEGVARYAAWCDATNKTNTETVMQASRFFGPGREYENEWDVPPPEVKVIRVPWDLDALVKFGREHGVETRAGEEKWEYRQRVEDHIAQQTL